MLFPWIGSRTGQKNLRDSTAGREWLTTRPERPQPDSTPNEQ